MIPSGKLNSVILFLTLLLFCYTLTVVQQEYPVKLNSKVISFAGFMFMLFGLGYFLTRRISGFNGTLESALMNLGVGLGAAPIFIVLANNLHIPLDVSTFILFGVIFMLYDLRKTSLAAELRGFTESTIKAIKEKNNTSVFIILLLSATSFSILVYGAFRYPWLEDDDPWEHAVGTKYVSIYKTYSLPKDVYVAHYMEPYPPTYDSIMALVHQLNDSVSWTLKYFTSLMFALSIIFSYYFFKEFSGSEGTALAASLILHLLPPYLGHFIWAHTLAQVIMFPTLYCIEKTRQNRAWITPSIVLTASMMVTQPLFSMIYGILYVLYVLVRCVHEKKIVKHLFFIGASGLLLSLALYWVPVVLKYGAEFEKINYVGRLISAGMLKFGHEQKWYTLQELVYPQEVGDIGVQKGLGGVVSAFTLISLPLITLKYWKREIGGYWIPTTLVWLVFSLVGLESWLLLPVSVFPARFFSVLAVMVALTSAAGLSILYNLLKKREINPYLVVLPLLFGFMVTSGYYKYSVQTSNWKPGVMWVDNHHIEVFAWMYSLPPGSTVFPACMPDSAVIGFNKLSFPWDREVIEFRKKIFNSTIGEIHAFLIRKGYDYMMVSAYCIRECNKTVGDLDYCTNRGNQLIDKMGNSKYFTPVYWSEGGTLLKVKKQA